MSAKPRLRLMPVVITAASALLLLKTIELSTHTSYLFVPPAKAESAPAHEEKPEASGHGEAAPKPADPKAVAAKPEPKAPEPEASPAERALLEALQKRRESLDARGRELEMRENLLQAAEKKLEDRLAELKKVEQSVSDVDVKRAEADKARLKNLVTLYETMKVKEAARIFDKLDSDVLLDVSMLMKPAKLAEIMGQMTPETAQRLTVALARRDPGESKAAAVAVSDLPKIEGKPSGR